MFFRWWYGYIGNENEILAEVQQELKSGNRLYSFGAGSSVNRFLLNRIAEIGRGVSYIIRHDEPIDETVEKFVCDEDALTLKAVKLIVTIRLKLSSWQPRQNITATVRITLRINS